MERDRVLLVSEMEVLDPELFFRFSDATIVAMMNSILRRIVDLRLRDTIAAADTGHSHTSSE
jgi:hypothetical protein